MKFKKCGFLFSLAMVFCFALPSFASAEEVTPTSKNVLKQFKDISVVTEYGSTIKLDKPIKGQRVRHKFYVELPPGVKKKLLYMELSRGNSWVATYNFGNYLGDKDKGEFVVEVLGNSYDTVTILNHTGVNVVIKELIIYVPDGADGYETFEDISNLNAIPEVDKVKFTWDNPKNSRFTGVKVYFEGEERFFLKSNETEVVSKNLEPDKSYKYKFVAMYGDKASEGIEKVIKTKPKPKEPMPLIKPPENVFLTPQNGKMVIAWDDVKSADLEGYNVYIDGKKVNDKPLKSNKLIVKSLENGKSYKVQISAVNKENAEGEKSKVKEEKPSSDALEVEYDVKMPFNPKDVVGVAIAFLLIVGPLILLGLAFKFYKPFITFLYNSIQNKKGRDEK